MDTTQTEADEFRSYIARWVDERLVPQAEALDTPASSRTNSSASSASSATTVPCIRKA